MEGPTAVRPVMVVSRRDTRLRLAGAGTQGLHVASAQGFRAHFRFQGRFPLSDSDQSNRGGELPARAEGREVVRHGGR